jgi:hypothetical protein
MREKAWSTPRVTIHRRLEICHLGMHFVHKKPSYALCRSCRGMLDLQLSYSNLGALQFNFLEKTAVEQGNPEMFLCWNALLRNVARWQAPDRTPAPLAGPRHRGTAATAGPTAPTPTSAPNTLSPRTAHPWAERTDLRRPINGITTILRPYPTIGRYRVVHDAVPPPRRMHVHLSCLLLLHASRSIKPNLVPAPRTGHRERTPLAPTLWNFAPPSSPTPPKTPQGLRAPHRSSPCSLLPRAMPLLAGAEAPAAAHPWHRRARSPEHLLPPPTPQTDPR